MMKWLKWLVSIVIVAILSVVVYITLIFDPNDFKPEIVEVVKKHTGRDLSITQDLSWTFFPTVGIQLGGISLSNPAAFKPAQMLEIKQAVAEVALMPLLKKEIDIVKLKLDGLTVNLVTQKNGASSFDGLVQQGSASKDDAPTSKPADGFALSSLEIGGIEVSNTQINIVDEKAATTQTFNLENFALGHFTLNTLTDFSYRFNAQLPDMVLESEGQGQLKVNDSITLINVSKLVIDNVVTGEGIPNKRLTSTQKMSLDVALDKKTLAIDLTELTADDIRATGNINVNYGLTVPKIVMKLDIGDINLDTFLPPSNEAPVENASSSSKPAAVEPDLTGLKALDLALDLSAKSIKVANMSTQNWLLKLAIKNGVVDITKLTANLYQGTLQLSAQLDGRQKVASYRFEQQLAGVQVRPLLIDAADVDLLSGAIDLAMSGKGSSLLPDNIKKNLNANGKFEVKDGSLYGVNIPQMIRSAQAKLKGDLSAQDNEERKTDFSSLTGTINLDKGVATNPDLAMASPLLRLKGAGNANLVTEKLEYRLTTSLVGSLKGQEADKEPLAGIDIPLLVTGSFDKPEYALDTSALLEGQLKQETDKAKDKLKDSLLKKLGGF